MAKQKQREKNKEKTLNAYEMNPTEAGADAALSAKVTRRRQIAAKKTKRDNKLQKVEIKSMEREAENKRSSETKRKLHAETGRANTHVEPWQKCNSNMSAEIWQG